jgi:hypothetical protein
VRGAHRSGAWPIRPCPGTRAPIGLGDGPAYPSPFPDRPPMVGLHHRAGVSPSRCRLSPPSPHRDAPLPGSPASPGDLSNWPKSILFVAGWGWGHATLDGEPLRTDQQIHFMVTQGMQDRETLMVRPDRTGATGAGAVNPAAIQVDFYIRSPEMNEENHPGREVFDHFFAMETWAPGRPLHPERLHLGGRPRCPGRGSSSEGTSPRGHDGGGSGSSWSTRSTARPRSRST